jgi:hypothetical protein
VQPLERDKLIPLIEKSGIERRVWEKKPHNNRPEHCKATTDEEDKLPLRNSCVDVSDAVPEKTANNSRNTDHEILSGATESLLVCTIKHGSDIDPARWYTSLKEPHEEVKCDTRLAKLVEAAQSMTSAPQMSSATDTNFPMVNFWMR